MDLRDNASFPPLPEFRSNAIRLQVFTHKSFFGRPTSVFEDHPSDPSPDNERLEHLGDAVLGFIVTDLIAEAYPCLRVGPSTKLRSLVVGNTNLAEISIRYQLPDKLLLHPAQTIPLRASANLQADVFESFIGGLYKDQGFAVVRAWLSVLLRPYIQSAYAIVRAQHGLLPPTGEPTNISAEVTADNGSSGKSENGSIPVGTQQQLGEDKTVEKVPELISDLDALRISSLRRYPYLIQSATTQGHLALFNQRMAGRKVEWIYNKGTSPDPGMELSRLTDGIKFTQAVKSTPLWEVQLRVDGEHFGRGRGITKKAARDEAAKGGLTKLGIVV